jgi:hypothetical protein
MTKGEQPSETVTSLGGRVDFQRILKDVLVKTGWDHLLSAVTSFFY